MGEKSDVFLIQKLDCVIYFRVCILNKTLLKPFSHINPFNRNVKIQQNSLSMQRKLRIAKIALVLPSMSNVWADQTLTMITVISDYIEISITENKKLA